MTYKVNRNVNSRDKGSIQLMFISSHPAYPFMVVNRTTSFP